MTRPSPSPSTRILIRPVLSLLGILLAGGASLAADPPDVPATAPTTKPATSPVDLIASIPQTKLEPIERAATVAEALAYSPDEKTILADVRDGDGQMDAAALYVLLRRASMLPKDPIPLNEADRPNVRNFWLEPDGYRGKLVAVKAGYVEHADYTQRVTFTRWWGKRAVSIVTVSVKIGDELKPMIVLTSEEPPAGLKKGDKLEFAALFYKLANVTEKGFKEGAGPEDAYPVLVARSIQPGRGAAAGGGPASIPLPLKIAFGAVAVLLMAFFILRRKIGQGRAAKVVEYKPLRFEEAGGVQRPAPAADEPVDEELVRQVKAYKTEHSQQDEPKDG